MGGEIKILLSEIHSEKDVLYAYVHGYHFRFLMQKAIDFKVSQHLKSMVSASLETTETMFEDFYETLQANKWDVSRMLIPRKEWRVNFSSSTANTKKEN